MRIRQRVICKGAAGKPDVILLDAGDLIFQIAIRARISCPPAHADAGSVIVGFGGGSWHIGITGFQALFKRIRVDGGEIVAGIVGATLDVVFVSRGAGIRGAVKIWAWIGCWRTRGT